MRIHVFQHVAFETEDRIADWALARGHVISRTRFHDGETPPAADSIDGLITLGGYMSVNDDSAFPWLKVEREFILHAIRDEKPVLGICLGAQQIARALGARVAPNAEKEIGWFPVTPTADACRLGWFLEGPLEVFHWHGETFDLPPGSTRLASSAACLNQAFTLGPRTVGLQFHLEMSAPGMERMLSTDEGEIAAGGAFVQSAEVMRARAKSATGAVTALSRLLDRLYV